MEYLITHHVPHAGNTCARVCYGGSRLPARALRRARCKGEPARILCQTTVCGWGRGRGEGRGETRPHALCKEIGGCAAVVVALWRCVGTRLARLRGAGRVHGRAADLRRGHAVPVEGSTRGKRMLAACNMRGARVLAACQGRAAKRHTYLVSSPPSLVAAPWSGTPGGHIVCRVAWITPRTLK